MIITRKWLNKYMDLSEITNKDIIIALNNLGFEVVKTIDYSQNNNFFIGRVISINNFVNNNINLCTVNINNNLYNYTVSKNSNLKKGEYVICNKLGISVYNNYKHQKNKINDICNGILCGFKELGINNEYLTLKEQNNIINLVKNIDIVLDNKNNVNILQKTNLGLNDFVFDINLTLNRSYCLSAYEIARELSFYFNKKLKILMIDYNHKMIKYKNNFVISVYSQYINTVIAINIDLLKNKKLLLSFSKRLWLKFNNYKSNIDKPLLDLAAQVAIETSQPLLLYDREIIKQELKITDNYENKEFNIKKGDLVIIDGSEFVELIGIKINSKYMVTSATKKIIILSLNIQSNKMRQQQKKVGILNIYLQRYIKPISHNVCVLGIFRYLKLLEINNCIKNISSLKWIKTYSNNFNKFIIISINEINNLTGFQFNILQIKKILTYLKFKIKIKEKYLKITAPKIRNHIFWKNNIIGEILRLYKYSCIKSIPLISNNFFNKKNEMQKKIINIENYLINNGFFQVKTFTLINEQEFKKFNFFNYYNILKLLSPLTKEQEIMRVSLLNSLLKIVIYNNLHNIFNIKLFTIEKIYLNNNISHDHLCFVSQLSILENSFLKIKVNNSFYFMKGIFETILIKMQINLKNLIYKIAPKNDIYHPYQTSFVFLNKQLFAILGVLHPKYVLKYNLKKTFFCEINLSCISNFSIKKNIFFNNFFINTPIIRDLSVMIKKNYRYNMLINKITKNIKYLIKTEVIDTYIGSNIPNNFKSLTIKFVFNSLIKQLQNKDVNIEFNLIILNCQKIGIFIR